MVVSVWLTEPKLFQGYVEWGITHSLSILLYELDYNMH